MYVPVNYDTLNRICTEFESVMTQYLQNPSSNFGNEECTFTTPHGKTFKVTPFGKKNYQCTFCRIYSENDGIYRFENEGNSVLLYAVEIHMFKKHPATIPDEFIEKVSKVFLQESAINLLEIPLENLKI
jgi:hypothetical protein